MSMGFDANRHPTTDADRRGLDLLLFFQVFPSSDVVFMLPADEVYDKDLLKSGFPQQSSVTSSLEPASARLPLAKRRIELQSMT